MDDAIAAMRTTFAAQFDEEDGTIEYRRFGRGAGIEVSERERERFLAEYDLYLKRYRRTLWVGGVGVTAAIFVLIAIAVLNDIEIPDSAFLIGAIAFAVVIGGSTVFLNRRAMSAPLRDIVGRPALGTVVTPREACQRGLRRIPWSNFGLGTGLIGLTIFRYDLYRTPWDGAHRYWSIGVAGFVALLNIQAVRKWHAGAQP